MKKFIVEEVANGEKGKILYYYNYNEEQDYTDIIMVIRSVNFEEVWYWEYSLDGKLSENDIHRESFFNDDNILEGCSSDDISELKEQIEDIEDVCEELYSEFLRI